MTNKLYYQNSLLDKASSVVISCEKTDLGYEVILNDTIFFAENGGMMSDLGKINTFDVKKVFERDGDTVHLLASPINPGETAYMEIDMDTRMRRMQNHTGEHIISGLAHTLFSAENVGFHADESTVTIDLDVKLSNDDVKKLERLANLAVYENHRVYAVNPSQKEAEVINYRSKLEILDGLRLVIIEDIDICACCALHLPFSAMVGIIKILTFAPHRKGTRIVASCGISALEYLSLIYEKNSAVSALLSSKADSTPDAVSALISENAALRENISSLKKRSADQLIEKKEKSDAPIIVFSEDPDPEILRYISLSCAKKSPIGAALSVSDDSVRYSIASESIDLKALCKEMNEALSGRGGGQKSLVQGSFFSPIDKVSDYISKLGI